MRKFLPTARSTFNDIDLVLRAVLDRGHYVCYLCRQHLPARIRVFVVFMAGHIRALNLSAFPGFPARGWHLHSSIPWPLE
ncbi:hypothetical protein [Paraburkholderia caribensis]|uniref:hypothetical protein n=1 Tax=Paraburkholderia caribensis TaxID=75105 RepID=UPI000A6BBC52|nr:hypothetical protein [Paraburkholderia caribensis]